MRIRLVEAGILFAIGIYLNQAGCGVQISAGSYNLAKGSAITPNLSSISLLMHIKGLSYPLKSHLSFMSDAPLRLIMAKDVPDKRVKENPVNKATRGLNALVDEFTASVKELVNAGEETIIHLAVGGGRLISALVDATGEVTKVSVETTSNVLGAVGSGVVRAVTRPKDESLEEESEKDPEIEGKKEE
jgi:hypothetical protein